MLHCLCGDLLNSDKCYPAQRWRDKLSVVLLAYNASVNRITDWSSLEAVFPYSQRT